jgi:hypothetical protein
MDTLGAGGRAGSLSRGPGADLGQRSVDFLPLLRHVRHSQGPREHYPIPLIPPQISDRLAAQHSRFTLHTNRRGTLAEFMRKTRTSDCCHLKRLTIPVHSRTAILRTLRLTGATHPDILPGLDSLATDIRERIELGLVDMRGPVLEESGIQPAFPIS